LKHIHEHTVGVRNFALNFQELDNVPIFDFHSWKHRIKESFHIFEGLASIDFLNFIVKLFEIWFTNIDLVPGIKSTHHCSSFIERIGGVWIDELFPDFFFDSRICLGGFTKDSCVFG
jgi:hypothetical protein